MPTRWNFSGSYTTRCTHCNSTWNHTTDGPEARDLATGRLVSDSIRYLNARDCFHSWCRECERAANARRPRRGTPRRGSTAAAAATANRARKFGVELELTFPTTTSRPAIQASLNAAGLHGWRVKGDASLTAPGRICAEIVSPPIQGEDGFEALRTACRILNGLGARPNRSCGLHVHHDIADLTIDAVKTLARDWYDNQNTIDGLVSPSRRSAVHATYCAPLTSGEVDRISRLREKSSLRSLAITRYKTLNLMSYGRHGTVEIRQHQGTCDYEKIRSWTLLGQAMIDRARTGQTLGTQPGIRGLLDRLGEAIDATAKTFIIGRAVEFGHATI